MSESDVHAYVEEIPVELPEEDDIPDEGELDPDDDYVEGVDAE